MGDALVGRERIIEAASTMEPLPVSITRLLHVVSRGDFDAAAIVEIVGHDPALAGEVLAQANSASSGARGSIGDLHQATARIGANAVVQLAVRRAMRTRLGGAIAAYGLGPNELWRHGVTTSVAAEVVREVAEVEINAMATTAALLHDVGKLVIGSCLPTSLTDSLVIAAERDSIDLVEAERAVLGIDHGEVGAQVLGVWGLPMSAQIALRHHHAPNTSDPLTHALALADHLAHAAEQRRVARDDQDDLGSYIPSAAPHAAAVGVPRSMLPSLVISTADRATEITNTYRPARAA